MGIPVLRGRTFSAADAQGTEGVIVDEYLARSFFGKDDPIGKPIIHNNRATIIGVVGNVTQEYLGQAPHPTIYHYYAQSPWISFTTAVVRSSLPDEQVAGLARAAVHDVDPQLPVFDVKSMSERISASLTPRRLSMFVLLGFAVLSLALSMIGIYGVMSYSTAQRTQEIGIRMALGASARDVMRMVLGGAMRLATIGVVVGALLFLAASHIVALLLYGVGPRDPLTIAGGIIVLGGVALLASYIPARRAARLDPLTSLRSE
jgi:putative ABC transport system permease protein